MTGGTHNRAAPPFEFLDLAVLPLLRRMGSEVRLEMTQAGFEPAGGGRYRLEVAGGRTLAPLELSERGGLAEPAGPGDEGDHRRLDPALAQVADRLLDLVPVALDLEDDVQ